MNHKYAVLQAAVRVLLMDKTLLIQPPLVLLMDRTPLAGVRVQRQPQVHLMDKIPLIQPIRQHRIPLTDKIPLITIQLVILLSFLQKQKKIESGLQLIHGIHRA